MTARSRASIPTSCHPAMDECAGSEVPVKQRVAKSAVALVGQVTTDPRLAQIWMDALRDSDAVNTKLKAKFADARSEH